MASRTISVEIVGDADSLTKAFNKVEGASKSLGGKLVSFGKVAAVGLAAVGAGAAVAGKKMLDLAGDAEETDSKLNVVFGKQLPALKKNLDKFSDATGASSFKLREQAADLGALLGPLTGSTKATSQMSEQFVKLATDLSSFNNVPVDDALLAIRSGLVGEAEPLRRFGVLLNEASVSAEAHRLGLVKGKEALTEQQKVMARGSLIMQQTTKAQGDAIRTSGSYTNSVRALKNTITDLATNMGAKLIPAATAVAGGLNDFINKISKAEGAGAKFQVAMDALKGIASRAFEGIKAVIRAIDWKGTWDTLVTSAKDVGGRLRDALDAQLGAVDWSGVGAKITTGITDSIQSVGAVGKKLAAAITAAVRAIDWNEVGRVVGPGLAAAIVTAFATLTDPSFWIKNWDLAIAVAVVAFGGPIGKIAGKLAAPLTKLGGSFVLLIVGGIERMSPRLAEAVLVGLQKIPGIVSKALNVLPSLVEKLFGRLGGLAVFTAKVFGVVAVINAVSAMARKVKEWLDKIVDWFAGLPGRIKGAIPSPGSLLTGIGSSIIGGLLAGLRAKWEEVAGFLGGLGAKIKALKGPESKDKTLLEPEGKAIILGLETGMMVAWSTLAPKINALGANIIHNFILGIGTAAPQFVGKLGQAAQTALDNARAVVEKYQAAMGDAFGKLGEYASRAFAARTSMMLDAVDKKFQAKIAKWQQIGAALTPAEQALSDLDKAEAKRSRDLALTTATAGGDPEAIRAAQLAITRATLEEQAALERAARDKNVAAQVAALEATKEREAQNLEERRRQLGEKLDAQLATLQERLSKHPEEYTKINKRIGELLGKFGITMKNSGELLGKAFAAGLRDAASDVEASSEFLAKIVQKYLRLKSPAERGPLSTLDTWFKPMGSMLAKQMDAAAIAGGAARMAAAAVVGGSGGLGAGVGLTAAGGVIENHVHVHLNGRELYTEVQRQGVQKSSRGDPVGFS